MFAFYSLGVKVDDSINTGRGPYVFRVNGLPFHRISSLVPAPNVSSKFAQLYVYDTANEVDHWMAMFEGEGSDGPDCEIVDALTDRHDPPARRSSLTRAPDACEQCNGGPTNRSTHDRSLESILKITRVAAWNQRPLLNQALITRLDNRLMQRSSRASTSPERRRSKARVSI
jgi:hypothetical protein